MFCCCSRADFTSHFNFNRMHLRSIFILEEKDSDHKIEISSDCGWTFPKMTIWIGDQMEVKFAVFLCSDLNLINYNNLQSNSVLIFIKMSLLFCCCCWCLLTLLNYEKKMCMETLIQIQRITHYSLYALIIISFISFFFFHFHFRTVLSFFLQIYWTVYAFFKYSNANELRHVVFSTNMQLISNFKFILIFLFSFFNHFRSTERKNLRKEREKKNKKWKDNQ